MSEETKDAMNTLRVALHNDEGYAIAWHSNIAMACFDAVTTGLDDVLNVNKEINHTKIHKMSNDAAARFMKNAFNLDTSDLISK